MTDTIIDTATPELRRARPIGRFLVAGFLILTVAPHYLQADWQANLKIVAAIAGFIVLYTGMHLIIAKYVPHLNGWLGAVLAVVPAALMLITGGGIGQMGALSYVGGSLFIDSLNGDCGCEVMAVPGMICGERTHLACILFTPLDWIEQRPFA